MEPCESLSEKGGKWEAAAQWAKGKESMGKEKEGKASVGGTCASAAESNYQLIHGHIFDLVHLYACILCFPEYFLCDTQNH